MQLAMCFVLLVASVLAGAFTSDSSSLQLRSQHSLDSSLHSKVFPPPRSKVFPPPPSSSPSSYVSPPPASSSPSST
jgi:hypothetical protein